MFIKPWFHLFFSVMIDAVSVVLKLLIRMYFPLIVLLKPVMQATGTIIQDYVL